jgi:hypothetical protein
MPVWDAVPNSYYLAMKNSMDVLAVMRNGVERGF